MISSLCETAGEEADVGDQHPGDGAGQARLKVRRPVADSVDGKADRDVPPPSVLDERGEKIGADLKRRGAGKIRSCNI
jgi:hypothetical protein